VDVEALMTAVVILKENFKMGVDADINFTFRASSPRNYLLDHDSME
jgi:hypothetical protein